MPFGNDGDYSRQRLTEYVNANLVNNLGNLCQRVASMLVKNFPEKCNDIKKDFIKLEFDTEIKDINFTGILQKIFSEATLLNQEFDTLAPWSLMKGNDNDKQKAFEILSSFIPKIITLVDALRPFCPHISTKLMQNLKFMYLKKYLFFFMIKTIL